MEENSIRRTMPVNEEAEQSVIGAMLMNRDAVAKATAILTPDDFYYRRYGILFETMAELYHEGLPVDLITLQNRLRAKDTPPEVAGLEFIGELMDVVPTWINIEAYAKIVAEKALLRRLIRAAEEIANDCYQDNEKPDVLLEKTEKNIFELLSNRKQSDFIPVRELALDALSRIEEASRLKNPITGVPTGFRDLDMKLSGMQPSDLILLAARPSMGKTAFALNVARHVSVINNYTTAIFSLEMSREQLMYRFLSMESGVDSQALRTGRLKDSDWDALTDGVGIVGNSHLIIDDTTSISLPELRSRCRKYKLEFGLDLIIVDYLQLMSSGERVVESTQNEVAKISKGLKALAREMKTPVLALSQLSRAPDRRTNDHRPQLSDLRDSGAIEQDADVVMFLYRDEVYNNDTERPDVMEVIVAKQRNGPLGTVDLKWLPNQTKLVGLARHNS